MQAEAQRQTQLAGLRANPASWLEYASLAGETPAIQPWMLPLMPQQYQELQAGAAIPGWPGTQTGSQEGATPLGGLPQLTTPSSQLLSRMSPASRQQFSGYRQARTGAPAEDINWRMWSQAPPGGRWPGLSYAR